MTRVVQASYRAAIHSKLPLISMPDAEKTTHIVDDVQSRRCAKCDYLLRGLPPQGTCPECGYHYTKPVEDQEQQVTAHKQWRWWDLYPNKRLTSLRWYDPRCRHCDYSLIGLGAAGQCPECGSDYDLGRCIGVREADPMVKKSQMLHGDQLRTICENIVYGTIALVALLIVFAFSGIWMTLVCAAVAAMGLVLWLYATDRLSVGMRENDRRARPCSKCGYDLRGSPAAGECPECGQLYDRGSGMGIRDT